MSVFTPDQFAFQNSIQGMLYTKVREKAVQICNCCNANSIPAFSLTGAVSERDCKRQQQENKVLTEKVLCTHTQTQTHSYVLRCINEHPYFPLWLQCNVQFNGLMFLNGCFMCMGLLCIYQPEAHLIRQLSLILD